MKLILIALVLLVPLSAAFANDGFRCPDTDRLVFAGETTLEVVDKCREPDARTTHLETRSQVTVDAVWDNGYLVRAPVIQTMTTKVDNWLFDFGPDSFVRKLRFENDRLVRVDEGAYGTRR